MSGIREVAILGAGTMGRRIAFGCLSRGIPVRLHDVSNTALEDAAETVAVLLKTPPDGAPEASMPAAEALDLLQLAPEIANAVAEADLVVESVPEDVELKKTVLRKAGRHLSEKAIVTTNTSAIPPSWLAEACPHPERLLATNFGPPEDLKVEVMGHPGTDPDVVDTTVRDQGQLFCRSATIRIAGC